MSTSGDKLIVLCTCPDRAVGEALGRALVEEGCAACVNLLPGVTSIYRWQGEVAQDEEVLLVAKTTAGAYGRLEACVIERHPYELPEVVAVPIGTGSAGYLAWIHQSVTP